MTWALWILIPLEPSPWWTRAPLPLLLVVVVVWRLCRLLIEKGLGTRRSICFRRRIYVVNVMFGTIQMDVYMNMRVPEAAIPQIVAIR